MTFESIRSGLAGVLASWAGDPEVRARIVTRTWPRVVGEQVARRTEARSFDDGVLHVAVLDTSWETTLRQMSGELVGRMNRALGKKVLRRIEWLSGSGAASGQDRAAGSEDSPAS